MKSGLEYFPLDVCLDEKFELIEAEFGLTGFAVVVKLLQRIYGQQGYYCEWTKEVALLFGRQCGFAPGDNAVSEIVSAAVRRGIFDKKLYERYRILTSRGIQMRYLEAVSRRKSVEIKKQYLLVDCVSNFKNVHISSEDVDIFQKNVDISEQSKVEESKEERYMRAREGTGNLKQVSAYFEETFGRLIGGKDRDIIVRIAGEYGPDLSLEAIRLAKERNANSAAYVLSILERWKAQGITHIDQVKKQNQRAGTKKAALPDYTNPALYQEEGDLDAVFGRYDPKNKG